MGVPVITLAGDRHAARVGASLLTAAGHPEWIAHHEDDYVRLAAELAADPARRARLRAGLRDDLRGGALLDHAGQSARFGAALRRCWATWCEANAAKISVAELVG
jgi:predicted O-linked N-acetylglucosamine transferase (SPINDLY family)